MHVTGTVVNYYFHCKRQCYLFGNRINLEDNSELVQLGRAIHEEKLGSLDNTEIAIDHIKVDKLTNEYLTEIKKSDADEVAAKWQVIFYLKVLKGKGIVRKGRLLFEEKKKSDKKVVIVELTDENEKELEGHLAEIEKLLMSDSMPEVVKKPHCKKCAYYEYCYV